MNKHKVSEESVLGIINCLKKNGIAIFPTDTVYGIGAVYNNPEGINRIFDIKHRDRSKPIIALISDIKYLGELVDLENENLENILEITGKYWPGELTVVFDRSKYNVAKDNTIGVRIPGNKILLEIIESCGGIVFTTSANISGEKSPAKIEDISYDILEKTDYILDGGPILNGVPSTVIKYSGGEISILREGNIKTEEILKLFMKKGRG
ncbi:L-threonylcarbamoyladenylate synthase [Sebaldella sp. S0638]|uniref:L-threonylcarbamoyladenylate synthase n=1 Tax=Sebaldella sp. S0638 TaxID=2957809 RepID=UPI00209FEF2D|nr:L-threonylcarbamoyladenylate synthase [Sebaldella sp. S0638]MCP1223673.1 L-threonylcarbamoyladenylate synthase [Sebaldella sp. S0638]